MTLKTTLKDIWRKTSERHPLNESEVMGFNEKWICPDFNPNGTRACFLTDHGWYIARWNNDHDEWITDMTDTEVVEDQHLIAEPPTHWMPMPVNPLKKGGQA